MNYHKLSTLTFFILFFFQVMNAQELASDYTKTALDIKGKVNDLITEERDIRSVYKFNEQGQIKEILITDLKTDKYNRKTTLSYNEDYKLLFTETYALNRGKIKETFKKGKIIFVEIFDEKGILQRYRKYKYDSLNNLIKKIESRYNAIDKPAKEIEYQIEYNKTNQIIKQKSIEVIDSKKVVTEIETYKYDADREKKEVAKYSNYRDKDSPPKIYNKVSFGKDSLDNKLTKYYDYNNNGEISSSQVKTTYLKPEGRHTETLGQYYMGKVHTIWTSKYDKYDNKIFYSVSESENEEYYRAKAGERNYQSRVKQKLKTKENIIEMNVLQEDYQKKIEYNNTEKMLVIIEDKFELTYDKQGNWIKKIKYSKSMNGNDLIEESEERIITYY